MHVRLAKGSELGCRIIIGVKPGRCFEVRNAVRQRVYTLLWRIMPAALPSLGGIGTTLLAWKWKLIIAGMTLVILATAAGALYYTAYKKGENKADVEIAQYEGKLQELNNELLKKEQAITNKVVREYNTKVIERERIIYRNRDVIGKTVPEQYKLSRGWVYAHDQSAKDEPINPVLASKSAPSTISDRQALEVVAENNARANETADRLEGLQTWVREQYEARNQPIATAPRE